MNEVNKRIGSDYKLFNYYGPSDAKHIIIAMGSVCETVEETIDYLNAKGEKVGLIRVRLYRPSPQNTCLTQSRTPSKISVLDRTKAAPPGLANRCIWTSARRLGGSKFESIPVYTADTA